jgi:3-oxo-5-alpha-steroid 4-dehydrogenase 3
VPQRWFLHFYVAGALANALTLGLMAFGLPATRKISAALAVADAEALTALALFQLHLVRRALETALLLEYPPGSRMHAIAYAFGMSYYLVVPLSLLPRGWSRRVVAEGWWSRAVATAAGGGSGGVADRVIAAARARGAAVAASLTSSRAWRMHLAGILLFLAAMALQLASHAALARLSRRGAVAKGEAAAVATVAAARETPSLRARSRGRRGKEEEDQEDQEQEDRNKGGDSSSSPYALPRGPLFALVSCPHYSAEVLLYAALALLTRLRAQLPLLMLGWVAVNLALAARATHAWYARRFGEAYLGSRDAPWWRQRRALVPFFM